MDFLGPKYFILDILQDLSKYFLEIFFSETKYFYLTSKIIKYLLRLGPIDNDSQQIPNKCSGALI
jgi:hypothetical protein